tara:strand:+ start:55 stop:282 length:228 start_codon:yes stop_codon:yes gene_type:complete
MIELTYIEQPSGNTIKRIFKTWKSVDKFVMKEKLEKYKVEGQSQGGYMLKYTSVLWEDFMAKTFHNYDHNKRTEW